MPHLLPLLLGVATSAAQDADLLLVHGHVLTMDAARTAAEAVAVKGGRIAWVGADADADRWRGPGTTVVDLRGHTLLPGFTDAHTHLLSSAVALLDIDLSKARSMGDLSRAITRGAAANPEAPWVRGMGWDLARYAGKLDRAGLDALVPDRPAYMESNDGHSAWVNARALAAAGITATTPDPPGGIIDRDAAGAPTGLLRENAVELVSNLLPPFPDAQVDQGLADGIALAHSLGITRIVEAYCEPWMIQGFQRADTAGRLSLRVTCTLLVDPKRGVEQVPDLVAQKRVTPSGRLRTDSAKFYLDGVLETKTARMLQPYTDGTNGAALWPDDRLVALAIALDREGFQLHAHTIGDGAVRQWLDAIAAVIAANGPRDRRPLAAHLQVIDPADLPRFAALGVWADFQALWAFPDDYITDLAEPFIGPERSAWMYPIGAVARAGGTWVEGSDWNVSSMNPWPAIETAVTRHDPDHRLGGVLTPQHAVTVRDALESCTIRGAAAAFGEGETGSIEVGKYADLVEVDRDPLAVHPRRLGRTQVIRTWVEGGVVYERR